MAKDLKFKTYFLRNFFFLIMTVPVFSSRNHIPLRITMLYVPTPNRVGENVILTCEYELGDEPLYHVKWYKNMDEFYRYEPENIPPKMYFRLPGVDVDVPKSDKDSVFLRKLKLESAGNYTCEVSSGSPSFDTVRATKQLEVLGSENRIPLRISMLQVPSPVVAGEGILLKCEYELGEETLFSLKWFKNHNEFYRYEPNANPPAKFFPLIGVDVDLSKSDDSSVYLRNLSLESAGSYTCEVNTDKPFFRSVHETKQLEVVEPPHDGPELMEEKSDYEMGDNVSILCNSGKSKPAPELRWYINDQLANSDLYDNGTLVYPDQMESTSSALRFRLEPDVFLNGKVTLKCVAAFNDKSTETTKEIRVSGTLQIDLVFSGHISQ